MNLVTLQEYKDFYGILNPQQDTKINMLISMISNLIQTYIGLDFEGGKTFSEVLALDYETNIIYLEHYPVDTIDSITESDRYTYDSTVHVPLYYASDYTLDSANGTLLRTYRPGGFANWPVSPGIISITYTTGNSTGTAIEIPSDLKLAAIELVSHYKDEDWKTKAIQGTTAGVSPLSKSGDFPQHIQVILDKYK